ncbi:MAG TPA: hypothetical protein ENJ04_05230 [Nitrospirae bacterium]|nr:hypothetical protein [Nitrospirota bacterium]
MITGKEDLVEAIIEAYKLEKGTRDFYDFASTKAYTDYAKETLSKLRDWEETHMHYLEFLYHSLQGDNEVLSFEEFSRRVRATHTESGLPVGDAEKMFEEKEFVDDTEVIIMALEIEGKAYNFYRNLSETAEDANARVIFKGMMTEEEKHIVSLRDLKMTTS